MFQNKTNNEIIGFLVTHFGIALCMKTHLDLLDTDITSKNFVCLRDVLKTSSRHVFKMSSSYVFKASWRRLQRNNFSSSKTSWRRLQRNNFSSSKTSSRRLARGLENVFKMPSRRLGRRKIVRLRTCWRRLQGMSWRLLQDILKTNKCLLGSLKGISCLQVILC